MTGALKKWTQNSLRKMGIYHRIKSSRLYDVYWKLLDNRILQQRDGEVAFYRALLTGLRPGDTVFDIGANHGSKTDIFLRLGAKVVSAEPDILNQQILTQRFLSYRRKPKPVAIVGKAVSDESATKTLWVDEPGSAKNTLCDKWADTLRGDESRFGKKMEFAEKKLVETTTIEDLVKLYGSPVFIKIDVEGHEPAVLRGLKRPVPYVSFEVNLPEFRPEGVESVQILGRLAASGKFNYATDCQGEPILKEWLSEREFLNVLQECKEPCVEVFWKAMLGAK